MHHVQVSEGDEKSRRQALVIKIHLKSSCGIVNENNFQCRGSKKREVAHFVIVV